MGSPRVPVSASLVLAAGAAAEEVTVQNDSFESGEPAVIVGDFVAGEHAGARLTSPCDGTIVAVQIGWLEGDPGNPPSLQQAIWIFDGASFPVPGSMLQVLEGPVLTPGFINEFRYLDEQQTVPLNVPVNMGQQFYVTLEFGEATDVGSGGASVFRDLEDCQAGKNVLFAVPGLWLDFCKFLAGDLVIRAVIDCGAGATGACCFESGVCNDLVTDVDCAALDGTFQGAGTTCDDAPCPLPTVACCFGSGCLDLSPADCEKAGGVSHGDGSACLAGDECPATPGACCIPKGSCLVLTESDCAVIPDTSWAGPGTDCTDGDGDRVADDCAPCPGDIDGDGEVGITDFLGLLAAWGPCPGCPEDIDGDDEVGITDFLALLAAWGPC